MKFIFYVPNISIAEWIGLVISFFGTIATCIIAGYNIFFQKKIKKDEKRYRNEKFVEAIRKIAVETDVIYHELPQEIKHLFIKAYRIEDYDVLLDDEKIKKLDTQISNLKKQLYLEHKILLSHLKTNKAFQKISLLEVLFVYMEMVIDIFEDIIYYVYNLDKNRRRLNLEGFIKLANSNNEYPSINKNNIDRLTILRIIYKKQDEYYTKNNKTIDPLKLILSLKSSGNDRFEKLEKYYHDLYSDKQIYKELDRIIEEI